MNKKVSVVIAAYNAESNIEECLTSLCNQTVIPNIIVVNDGSTDSTVDRILSFKRKTPKANVTVITQSNQGVASARNKGLSYVQSNYVTFVDSDDIVKPDYIETLLNGFINSTIDISVCNYEVVATVDRCVKSVSEYGKIYRGTLDRTNTLASLFYSNGMKGFVFNKLFKSNIIKKYLIQFDNKLKIAEDLDFCFNYCLHINNAYLNDRIEYFYRKENAGLSSKVQLASSDNVDFDLLNLHLNFLNYPVCQKSKIVNSNIRCQVALCAVTCYRSLFLNNTSSKHVNSRKKKTELAILIKKNCKYVLLNRRVGLKEKVKIIFILLCPAIIKIIDKRKFRIK